MHGFVNMGGQHISFRDPFVFLLHSNVDRLFAMWQTAHGHPERLDPDQVYVSGGSEPTQMNNGIRPWFGNPPTTRPWAPPENEQVSTTYKHPSVVIPRRRHASGAAAAGGRAAVVPQGPRRRDPVRPPADQLDVEVVVRLDSLPNRALGFRLRPDGNEAARRGMLDVLRTAFNQSRRAGLDYDKPFGVENSLLIRVARVN